MNHLYLGAITEGKANMHEAIAEIDGEACWYYSGSN